MARRKVAVCDVPAPTSMSYGCRIAHPRSPQYRCRVRITSWNVGITNSCGKSGLKSPDEKSELYSNPDTRTRRKGGEHELSLVARCSLACAVHRARFRAGALGYGQG